GGAIGGHLRAQHAAHLAQLVGVERGEQQAGRVGFQLELECIERRLAQVTVGSGQLSRLYCMAQLLEQGAEGERNTALPGAGAAGWAGVCGALAGWAAGGGALVFACVDAHTSELAAASATPASKSLRHLISISPPNDRSTAQFDFPASRHGRGGTSVLSYRN